MMRQFFALVLIGFFAGTAFAGDLDAEFERLSSRPQKKTVHRKSTSGRHRLGEMHTTPERWAELQSDNAIQNDEEPKRQARKYAPRAASTRGPASVPSALPAVSAGAPVFPVASLTFKEYLADNAHNPSMDRHIADHQKAFADTAGPAVITAPGSDTSASAANVPANPAAAAGGNSGAIQAATAAAVAAGLLPSSGGASSSSSSAPPGPIR